MSDCSESNRLFLSRLWRLTCDFYRFGILARRRAEVPTSSWWVPGLRGSAAIQEAKFGKRAAFSEKMEDWRKRVAQSLDGIRPSFWACSLQRKRCRYGFRREFHSIQRCSQSGLVKSQAYSPRTLTGSERLLFCVCA